jgi:hypothetical protein
MSTEEIAVELNHINEKLGELLDEVASLLIWTIQFSKKHHLEKDEALGHHIQRIRTVMAEIAHPPSLKFALSDAFIHPKASDEDSTAPRLKFYIRLFLPTVTDVMPIV